MRYSMIDTKSIFKIKPILTERIWGTKRLASMFDEEPSDKRYGEVILASSMDSFGVGDTTIEESSFHEFYQKNKKEMFGLDCETFPLRVNLIDTSQPLSIQVHPDYEITQQFGLKQGINEFWFVIEAQENSTIEIGHSAKNLEQFINANNQGKLMELLHYVPAHVGDYFFLPPGTVHAIGSGILTYELTYNIDLTYRVYDYDRVNEATGQKRELHLDQAFSAITFPQKYTSSSLSLSNEVQSFKETTLIDKAKVFTVKHWQIDDKAIVDTDNYYLCTIIEGAGTINGHQVRPYETWFLPLTTKQVTIIGNMKILAATYREN